MGFINGVLAPSIAASLLSPSANLSNGAERTSLLRANFERSESLQLMNASIQTIAGHWTWNGIELHETSFKTAYTGTSEANLIWYAGKIPDQDKLESLLWNYGYSHALHPTQAQSLFAEHLRVGSWNVPLPERVFRINKDFAEAWWRVKVGKGGRIFWLRESDGFWGEEPEPVLHADAKAFVYRENKVASAATGIEEIAITDLLDISYLRNRIFRILNCVGKKASYSVCGNFARSLSGVYDYPFESPQHSEMVGYYSIQRAVNWHRGIQSDEQKKVYTDFGLKGPLDVFVRADKSDGPSYSPRSSSLETENPIIYVSTGIETDNSPPGVLALLTKDSDVYLHEFSHHIIYRSVVPKRSSSQPRAMQEGLADYFTYAMTGNNKLGESTFGGTPLREGNLTIGLSADLFAPDEGFDPYILGTVLSSTLWKLRENLGDWKNGYKKIDKIVWDSIDLLPELATYYQFGCALLKQSKLFETSEKLTAGSLSSVILKELADKSFFANETVDPKTGCPAVSSVLQDIDNREAQKSELPLVDVKTPPSFTGEGRSALPPFGGSLYQPLQPRRSVCGDVAGVAAGMNTKLVSLLYLSPLLVIMLRIRRFFRWRGVRR